MKKIFGIILNIVIGLLLLLIVLRIFIPNITLNVFGVDTLIVSNQTQSMYPILRGGDTVVIRRINRQQVLNLQPDDIIIFYANTNSGERLVIHYFVRIEGERVVTRPHNPAGAPNDPVSWGVTVDRVVARYAFHIPTARFFAAASQPLFLVSFGLVIAGIIGLLFLSGSKKKQTKLKETDNESIGDGDNLELVEQPTNEVDEKPIDD